MPDQRKALLFDAEAAAVRASKFMGERTFAQYVDDELVRSAVERQLGILGEALSAPAVTNDFPLTRRIP